jgi:hypothetical protein
MRIWTRPRRPTTTRDVRALGAACVDHRDRALVRLVVGLATRVSSQRWRAVHGRGGGRGAAAGSGPPSSAAKHAPESKRGTHIQSIDPSRPTSAAVTVSPISA